MKKGKRNAQEIHSSQSWYMTVLVKNTGSTKKAREEINKSKIRLGLKA